MSIDSTLHQLPRSRYPLHTGALERHALWARDFASVGDLDSAIGELRDIHAIAAELRAEGHGADADGSS